MCKKENGMYKRATGEEILARHSTLQPRMRAILFDWLVEVCEVYRLHRETFYLAVDFIDRYLGATSEMPKTRLQLVGKIGDNYIVCNHFKSSLGYVYIYNNTIIFFRGNMPIHSS